jgi:hypothetical protein
MLDDTAKQQVRTCSLKTVERSSLGHGQQAERGIESAGAQPRLHGGQRAIGTPRGIVRQFDRALQERSRGRDPAARRARCSRLTMAASGSRTTGATGCVTRVFSA